MPATPTPSTTAGASPLAARRPLRVLHVASSTDRRGAETAAVEIARVLADHFGHHSDVVALAPGHAGGVDVPTLGPTRFSLRSLWALRDRASQNDVVVAHGSSALPAASAALVGTDVPLVYRSIGDPLAWMTTALRRARVRVAVGRVRLVIALWPGAAVAWHEILRVPAARVAVIPNASGVTEFTPASSEQRRAARVALGLPLGGPVVLCLGALTPEKRIDLAVRAVALLDEVHLVVVGDGPQRSQIVAQAASMGQGRVQVLGATDRPQLALAAADLLVVPSDTEGQPAVAIEAGLSGLAVVATRVGGVAEIVEHGRTGILVPPGDAQRIADGIRQALASGPEMGAEARLRCQSRFDLRSVAAEWDRLLVQVACPLRRLSAR